MEKKEQRRMRFTDVELSMIKNTFADNEDLALAMRKVFLQLPVTQADKNFLSIFKGKPELMKLMWKTFKPDIDPEAPLHQLIDLWMSVDVKDKPIGDLMPVFQSRELLIELLEQQLKSLEKIGNGKGAREAIKLEKLLSLEKKTPEQFYVNLLARNTLITHCEAQLTQLSVLAGQKDETVDQTKDRLMKDSNK